MENKSMLLSQVITGVVAVVASLGAALITSNYTLESAKAQIEKDKVILSAANANENAKEIRIRAEKYLLAFQDLMELLGKNHVAVEDAHKQIQKMDKLAQGLLVYGGVELGTASFTLNLALKNALVASSKEAVSDVFVAAKAWYPTYFSVIKTYDNHAMPKKAQADLQDKLMGSLLGELNKAFKSDS
ncbi:TPA: hypothetical protein ACGVAU_004584 [Vibrio vulnificus]|uniref:hypothetical protein n=1 Tax=Vibrio vulnificus TaxID=672 RepID=UPI000A20A545|nr:hypothetical protein [Vibrio vulnificus]ARN66040.1 hypothetical protein FORC36_1523 [Vibrio vulnificus]EHZ7344682.1 hypothetical protein [Vibrio vulnificus]EID4426172.1 hypothetical protein [Vibrio vulnificus]ELE1962755.1 hypothetical protein [Vibrio vulnificus]ELL0598718.1 hypothetical protein [Vibrio vulnificus]